MKPTKFIAAIVVVFALASMLNEVFGAPKGRPEFFTAGETLGTVAFQALTR